MIIISIIFSFLIDSITCSKSTEVIVRSPSIITNINGSCLGKVGEIILFNFFTLVLLVYSILIIIFIAPVTESIIIVIISFIFAFFLLFNIVIIVPVTKPIIVVILNLIILAS